MPTWVPLALLVPVALGWVNVIDKIIIDRYVRNSFVYPMLVGFLEGTTTPFILGALFLAGVEEPVPSTLGWGMVIGVLRATTLISLIAALRSGQVSRVVALWFLSPVVVAILATSFLGESLPMGSWIAVVAAAAGAVTVSWSGGAGGFVHPKTVAYALLAALAWAIANVLVKHVGAGEDFWQLYVSSRVGFAFTLMLLALHPAVRSEALHVRLTGGVVGFVLLAEVLVTGGLIASFAAIRLGPVSLVVALGAVQPPLVLLYSVGLVAMAPERFRGWVTRGNLRVQLLGTVVLAAGVFAISLR